MPHGTNARYAAGCDCVPCRLAKTAHERSKKPGAQVQPTKLERSLQLASDSTEWMDAAACKGRATDTFYPVGATGRAATKVIAEAKAVCAVCPVVDACLEWAIKWETSGQANTDLGVWGGLTTTERYALLRRRRRADAIRRSVPQASAS